MHVAILGAGISGLATAWFLRHFFGSTIRLTVIEKNSHPGGWVETCRQEGFLFEQGARSCRSKGAGRETLALIEALGLQEQVLTPHPDARHRYLYEGQQLQRLPRHLWQVALNPLTRGWLNALWRDERMPKRQEADESIHAFFSRRLGLSWTERLIDPFVSGIYAGDCRHLSLKSCFPLFDQWEQKHGSLMRGAWRHSPSPPQSGFIQRIGRFPLFSFREGMQVLPLALARELSDCIVFGQEANQLHFSKEGVKIVLANGGSVTADHLISTLSTSVLASLLPAYPLLATRLKTLPYASVSVINMGFHQAVLPFKGFGYLIPSKAKLPVLGSVWDSCIFPEQNLTHQTRLAIMMGGSHHPQVEHMSQEELIAHALNALHTHLGIWVDPYTIQVKQAHQAIPQFEVGYSLWKKKVEETINSLSLSLTLSGCAWAGVSINDCIAQARRVAERGWNSWN